MNGHALAGSKILFRVSLTLIKNGEPKLLTCQNFPSIVTTFSVSRMQFTLSSPRSYELAFNYNGVCLTSRFSIDPQYLGDEGL